MHTAVGKSTHETGNAVDVAGVGQWSMTKLRESAERVFRIDKSNSGLRFVLTLDSGKWGWDQKGDYIQTLKGRNVEEALSDTISKYPNEEAFFVEGGCKWISNCPEFDSWFNNLEK